MGQVRHGSATTTHAVRAAIQRSKASAKELSRTYGVNPKTVLKWRNRETVEDRKTGPKDPRSTVLSEDEEAAVVASTRAEDEDHGRSRELRRSSIVPNSTVRWPI